MTEELNLEDILDSGLIDNLFSDVEETQDTPPDKGDKKDTDTTEDIDVDKLFTDDTPESVGSEEDNKDKQEDTTSDEGGSPNKNVYSSITNALEEDGIFTALEDSEKIEVKTAEDFANYIEKQVQSKLEDKLRRIDEALNADIEPTVIKQYENTINYLENISDETISAEGELGEQLRKQLIWQDLINRGFTKERAQRELKKSLDSGSDIEDAKDALASNKQFFLGKYNDLINEAKEELQAEAKERQAMADELKKSILEEKQIFGDLDVDKNTRLKIFENISKPVYKDPETGEFYTAIQKYEKENRLEFLKNVSAAYTLTNGFKDLGKLLLGKVNKEKKKALSELERTINHTRRTSDGNLQYVGTSDDNSYIGKGLRLDI